MNKVRWNLQDEDIDDLDEDTDEDDFDDDDEESDEDDNDDDDVETWQVSETTLSR